MTDSKVPVQRGEVVERLCELHSRMYRSRYDPSLRPLSIEISNTDRNTVLDAARQFAEAADLIDTLKARIAELEGALGWFVDDDRFVVGVGGNPNVVERMIQQAADIYRQATKEPQDV